MPDDNETDNIEHVSAFSGIMRSPQRPFFDSQQSWDLATDPAYGPKHKTPKCDTINRPGISSVLRRNLTGTRALDATNIILKKLWDFN